MEKDYGKRIELLRTARLELLRLHKNLVDFEREIYERENGRVSSGSFLQLLLNEKRFNWLRAFSQLIVEIDERFDLDDGIDMEMTENYLKQIHKLVNFEVADEEFRSNYKNALQADVQILSKHTEIKKLLSEKEGT